MMFSIEEDHHSETNSTSGILHVLLDLEHAKNDLIRKNF